MELYNATVLHGGRLEMAIPKNNLTVPEIAILRHLHGSDAVKEIHPCGSTKRQHTMELDRLRHLYQKRLADGPHPIEELWPGTQQQNLPTTLSDIGIGRDSPYLGSRPKSAPPEDAINYYRMDDVDDTPYSDDEEADLDAAAAEEVAKSEATAKAAAAKPAAPAKPAAAASPQPAA
ncbi:hypothetical protein T8K17_11230 [Thalassobaculum sp. OXR-137]|uniref:hypothetical protein n=1 Tax=Thalassobaculum sp. OXR-137 TaxID=3100173 RepID=UPI002AC9C0B3|nr:hypothetical protein [Thalassobaculum sp. OXR-137]WPZ36707.1 hypothetical protein T8K17_11230 [Thalassobaculum sp. OXR-137]